MKPRSYITFPIFDKFSDLICVLSTRSGGYSQGIYGSQNMGLRSGDTVSVVEKNRKQFFGLFKISQQQIAFTVEADRHAFEPAEREPHRAPIPPPQPGSGQHERQRGIERHRHAARQRAIEHVDTEQPTRYREQADRHGQQSARVGDPGKAGRSRPRRRNAH